MNSKTLGILVVLCALFAYFGLKQPEQRQGKGVIENITPLEKVDLNSVTEVTIKKGEQTLTLKKVEDQWRATNTEQLDFPINFAKFREFLLSVRDLKLESRITRSKTHAEKFGLADSNQPTQVTLKAGSTVLGSLSLGSNKEGKAPPPNPSMPFNMGAPAAGQYMHLNSDESIYLIPEPLKASMDASNWMIEAIAEAKQDEMSSIEFHYPHKNFKLEKDVQKIEQSTDGSKPPKEVISWKASGDLPASKLESGKVKDLLDDLKNIKVTKPVKADTRKKFDGSEYGLKVSRGDNAIYELKANQVGNDWYIWDTQKENEIYQISSFRFEDIFSKNDDLFGLGDIKVADNVQEISVKRPGANFTLTKSNNEWQLKGQAPTPKVAKDKVESLTKLMSKLSAQDYHSKNLSPASGAELHIKAGGKSYNIKALGNVPLESGKLIQIGGQKVAYSLSEGNFNSVFPNLGDLVEFKAPSENSKALKAITYQDFSVVQKDEAWQFPNGDAANSDSVEAFWTSYEAIFDSPYQTTGKIETVKNSVKITHSDDSVETIQVGSAQKGLVSIKSSRFGGIFKVNLDLTRSLFNGRMAFAQAVDKIDSSAN